MACMSMFINDSSYFFQTPWPNHLLCSFKPPPTSLRNSCSNSHRFIVRCSSLSEAKDSTKDLKMQLEALQSESDEARARANAARSRFLRLSESVENLRKRAVLEIKAGKEENARQLLAEKQKVMQALEKSKQRAEVLEELSNKLSEAISSKEVQLIAELSSTPKIRENNDAVTVRIVSPKEETSSSNPVDQESDSGSCHSSTEECESVICSDDTPISDTGSESDPDVTPNNTLLGSVDSYSTFLWKVDNQLNHVEIQMDNFLSVAKMVLPEAIDITSNEKVAIVKEVRDDVISARSRIKKLLKKRDLS